MRNFYQISLEFDSHRGRLIKRTFSVPDILIPPDPEEHEPFELPEGLGSPLNDNKVVVFMEEHDTRQQELLGVSFNLVLVLGTTQVVNPEEVGSERWIDR